MGILGWVFYVVMGFGFFGIISYLKKKYNITKLQSFIFTLILLMVVAGLCFRWVLNYTDDIFLIIVFMMLVDIIYTSYFTDGDFFDISEKNILYYIVLIIGAFILNQEFINKVTAVFLTGEDLRIVLWFLSIIFIYNFCNSNKIFTKNDVSINKFMSSENVLVNYVKLKHKYYDVLSDYEKDIQNIVYAVMIYENNRRSKILRNIDYFLFRINGNKRKLGIMQIESSCFISDIQSIEISCKEVSKLYNRKSSKKEECKAYNVIEKYSEDSNYVRYIFDIINKF